MDISAVIGVSVNVLRKFSHLSRTGHLMPPRAGWNAPVCSLLQLVQRPLRKAGRAPWKERTKTVMSCVNVGCVQSKLGVYLLERVEGDVQASSGFLMTNLRCPVDVLEDKLNGCTNVLTVNCVALLVHDNVGCGWARRLQLQLWTYSLPTLGTSFHCCSNRDPGPCSCTCGRYPISTSMLLLSLAPYNHSMSTFRDLGMRQIALGHWHRHIEQQTQATNVPVVGHIEVELADVGRIFGQNNVAGELTRSEPEGKVWNFIELKFSVNSAGGNIFNDEINYTLIWVCFQPDFYNFNAHFSHVQRKGAPHLNTMS